MDFVIRYGAAAGFEDEALALARRLFAHFDEAIDSLTLVPVDSDEFALLLDGRLIHSRVQSGRAPRVADVVTSADQRCT
jgi:predicted Rdx family selenoprotein